MKESIGYTVTLNIIIVFITIVVAFLCAALIFFKSNKASKLITDSIEKYEGYNNLAIDDINRKLSSLGYGSHSINCPDSISDENILCSISSNGDGTNGYCVYVCYEENKFDSSTGAYIGDYYFYKIRTNMMINIPIINDILDIPIYSNTNRLYNFEK